MESVRDDEFERMTEVANRIIARWNACRNAMLGVEPAEEIYLARAFLKYAKPSRPDTE